MLSTLSFIVSAFALAISGITAWLTLFHRGKLLMTQPTTIFFGPDGSSINSKHNKIYLRTLLYSTSKRGQVLESLYITIHRNETQQNFNIWVYRDKNELKRGSGLFVPQEGVTYDHHFLLPKDGANFEFLPGNYKLKVFAKLVAKSKSLLLSEIDLKINESQGLRLKESNAGIFFDWGPDQQDYHSHIDIREKDKDIEEMLKTLLESRKEDSKITSV